MTYNFPDSERNDTLNEVEFQLKINTLAINLTGSSILATFMLNLEVRTMTIGSGLSFTDAAQGKFKVNEQIIDWKKGRWAYEIQFTFTDGRKKTYLKGFLNITD